MGHDYSYSQPDSSDQYDQYSNDTEQREIEALIRMDEAESSFMNSQARVYPPQPEVEFGFPKVCYCGGQPLLSTSNNRRFFTCGNIDDGEMHIHKWWDEAVMEEMREMGNQCEVLSQKVDNLALSTDYGSHMSDETEQKLSRIEKEVFEIGKIRNRLIIGFELIALVAIVGMALVAYVLARSHGST
ncbi:PREDICTED: uncharacterized protein LOC104742264 [Camelina sativa]|uniref:Uncharacterized protein LOC104742264 n=1 Tax=Camelina sativa TaxID=90675 RepID=A0ABM1QML7_CAMSA|nr:PREDICTED: uncharacterized protein LOC104742264 [Camelina sativa]XP_019088005.1 PREDICTED: uncharacterized protein LOC104742264 [Camelina sativa]